MQVQRCHSTVNDRAVAEEIGMNQVGPIQDRLWLDKYSDTANTNETVPNKHTDYQSARTVIYSSIVGGKL